MKSDYVYLQCDLHNENEINTKKKKRKITTSLYHLKIKPVGFELKAPGDFFCTKRRDQRLPTVFHAANCIWWQQSETASFIFFRQ